MANDLQLLNFTKIEEVPEDTTVYRVDDGTTFYNTVSFAFDPERLYVKWRGKEIDAALPDEEIYCGGAHGNAIFFEEDEKIYAAVFSSEVGICISYQRDLHEGSHFNHGGLYTCLRDGKECVFRMHDDPDTDGIVVDLSIEEIQGLKLLLIHRNKAIYSTTTATAEFPDVNRLRDNVIVIGVSDDNLLIPFTSANSSPLLYFAYNESIFTLCTDTMQFLPPLSTGNVTVSRIVEVNHGVITLQGEGKGEEESYLMAAPLPEGYYYRSGIVQKENAKPAKVVDLPKEMPDISISTEGLNELTDQCCCSICSEIFDSIKFIPQVLDCGHTFCEKCIHNENVCINRRIQCPNCSIVTMLSEGKALPKNFAIISMAEQLMKSRTDPKITCKACHLKFSQSSVRMCIQEGCTMYNELICTNCALDGGHGAHVVKYDFKMKKIRDELRVGVDTICAQVEDMKSRAIAKTKEIVEIASSLEKRISETKIPAHVLEQLDSLASEEEAIEYKEIVGDLACTIIEECKNIIDAFDAAIGTANINT